MSASMAYRTFLFCKPVTAILLTALVVANALLVLAFAARGQFELSAATQGVLQLWVISLYMEQMRRTTTVTRKP